MLKLSKKELNRELSLHCRLEVKHCVLDDSFGEPPLNLPLKGETSPSPLGEGWGEAFTSIFTSNLTSEI